MEIIRPKNFRPSFWKKTVRCWQILGGCGCKFKIEFKDLVWDWKSKRCFVRCPVCEKNVFATVDKATKLFARQIAREKTEEKQ